MFFFEGPLLRGYEVCAKKICLFPAPIDSEIGLQLRERDDVNVRFAFSWSTCVYL